MKMLLAKVVSPKFQASLNKLASQDIPVRAMYKMKGIVRILRDEIAKFEEIRNERAVHFAEKDEHGKPLYSKSGDSEMVHFKMDPENMIKFSCDLAELVREEIDVAEVHINELGDLVRLNSDDLLVLEFVEV